jgi:hypothetical protein
MSNLLPADKALLEILKFNHNVELTEEDLKVLNAFHWQMSLETETRLANDPNSVYYDTKNGKVVGFLAFAAVGFFAAPLLGVASITGVLIGASIGWRLFMSNRQQSNKNTRSAQTFGFDSAPSVVPLGDTIPLIFCNREINPNGGVRTSGAILNSRVNTFGGVQNLLALYTLGVGQIGNIDQSEVLINGQPRDNFFVDEFSTFVKDGVLNQELDSADFPYYSQTQSASNNNQFGVDKRGKPENSVSNKNYLDIEDEEVFETFVPADRYICNGQEFRIINRDVDKKRLYLNRNISAGTGDNIYAIYQAKYSTSKKCTEIHLNLLAQLWARDSSSNLKLHAIAADVYVDEQRVCRIYMQNKSEASIRRRLILTNLTYAYHTIKIIPLVSVDSSLPLLRLGDNKNIRTHNSGVTINGKEVLVQYEQKNGYSISSSTANSKLTFDGKEQVSSDRNAPCQLTTVCEIVKPSDLGHSQMCDYKGLTLTAVNALASNRLQGDPSPNWFITKGIIGRVHLAANVANGSSSGNTLTDLTGNFISNGITTSHFLRNLDKQIESQITNVSSNSLTTATSLNWSQGDRYLVYDFDSLVYFPDIYVHTLTSKQGGLGSILPGDYLADFFVDYPSIVKSRKFCVSNKYFWDGAIAQSIPWSQFATQESLGSLLFPSRFGGRFGLVPEQYNEPVALFNASNIIENSYSEDYAPKQRLNCVHVTFKDGSDKRFRERTVSIMTQAAFSGNEPLFPESLKLDSVTNEYQAVKVAQVYLKTRLLQSRTISFSTGLQGFGIREGDLIIVQHISTEIDKESSGFVTQVIDFGGGANRVRLSTPFKGGLTGDYSASVLRLADGSIQRSLGCQAVRIEENGVFTNWLEIYGLSASLSASRENFSGDYVVIGKDITSRRTYRVSKIEPQEDGSVNITAVLWVADMLSPNGLVTVN